MSLESSRQIVYDWFERVWNQLDQSAIEDLMHPECEVLGVGPMAVGRNGFTEHFQRVRAAFDEIHTEVVDLVVEESAIAGHVRFSGKHRVTGRSVDFVFSVGGRLQDGQFIWVRNVVDFTVLLAQLNYLDVSLIHRVFESE